MTTLTMSHWHANPLTPILKTTVGGVLRAAAWRAPDRVALIDADRRWTYAELLDEAERAARGLLARFEPGEPVGWPLPQTAVKITDCLGRGRG